MTEKKPSIGAFYQCFKRQEAVVSVVQSFRDYYPNEGVFMVCDGGYDYKKLAEHFGAHYEYEVSHVGNEKTTIFSSQDQLLTWLRRVYRAAEYLKEDYILVLEDDVSVRSEINEKLRFTINGVNKDVRLGREITSFLKKKNKSIPWWRLNYFWGGFGGCVINRKFILENFKNIEEDIKVLKPYVKYDLYSSDIWLTILVLYHGGTIGPYEGLCETWYELYPFRRDFKKDIAVLHQYKEIYGRPLTDADRSILGDSADFS